MLGQRAGVDPDPHRHPRLGRSLSATSATFSRPPMLPGLSRMQWAPASIAFSARVWLKWMSAITGIGERLTIVFSATASSSRGTATRTRSAPASATLLDLLHRRLEVRGLGLGHRLHGDRRPAADRHPADEYLALGGHVLRIGACNPGRFGRYVCTDDEGANRMRDVPAWAARARAGGEPRASPRLDPRGLPRNDGKSDGGVRRAADDCRSRESRGESGDRQALQRRRHR